MSILDDLGGILNQGSSATEVPDEQAMQQLQQAANQMPQPQLGGLLSDIFQSPETGTFGQNVSQMYSQSNPQQKAGILNRLIQSAGPGMPANIGLGGLAGMLGGNTQITPEQTSHVQSEHVEQMANQAQQQNPGIVQEAANFYAQHPMLVQSLGAGVAAWALRRRV
jgi:hypothetical protein